MSSYSSVKKEFFRWISSLNISDLGDIDKKFLNLLINNFDVLVLLGTAGGARARKIGQLIEQQGYSMTTLLPKLSNEDIDVSKTFRNIEELKIGPFRGFSVEETFIFDKKYTFMYGPNGSGKSSFCEGLEYALLGGIEEAESKRIDLTSYTQNVQTGKVKNPIIWGSLPDKKKVEITPNSDAYRFSFVEKNRIEGFARIGAATAKTQLDRISTLFGLDAFSEFVNGFSDIIDERYLTIKNKKEEDFKNESVQIEAKKVRSGELSKELVKLDENTLALIKEFGNENIKTLNELKIYFIGYDGASGIIGALHTKKAENIPIDIDSNLIERIKKQLKILNEDCYELDIKLIDLERSSSEINFKDLYSAIKLISEDTSVIKTVCPACKTPLDKVVINPFINAANELVAMNRLAVLQADIKKTSNKIVPNIHTLNKDIMSLNKAKETVGNTQKTLLNFKEFAFTSISSISSWLNPLLKEKVELEYSVDENKKIILDIKQYNAVLCAKREEQKNVDTEILKFSLIKQRLDEIEVGKKAFSIEKEKIDISMAEFFTQNQIKIKAVDDLKKIIAVNIDFSKSYSLFIGKLKAYRNLLPSQLASGLADRTREYYNIMNSHDPDFEKLEMLKLPTTPGDKLLIRFYKDKNELDALQILSEGHIKILGLSLLLSKIVNDDLGFIIFDDIVNAIDDEHRDGIADLLLKHEDLKDRQHILTCHGEMFISKLEHKLGASTAGKEVRSYRFIPSDINGERGVKISIGNSKHYLLLARDDYNANNLKDAASRCRQAIESISENLWIKMAKKVNVNITVKLRGPGARPDLSSVVDGLIKEIQGIEGLSVLLSDLKQLKEKYPWSLLNKGIHEQGDLPEFERHDIFKLLDLLEKIEKGVCEIKLEVISA